MKKNLFFNTIMLGMIMFLAGNLHAQVTHFELGFGPFLPDGWTEEGVFMTSTESNRNVGWDGHYGGSHAVKMNAPTCIVTTKPYYTAGTLSFWVFTNQTGEGEVLVEKSADGENWVEILKVVSNDTLEYTEYTVDIDDDSPAVQIKWTSSLKNFYLDDAKLTSMAPAEDNAYLFNLGVDGENFSNFQTVETNYTADITYPAASVLAETFHPDATYTVDMPQPAEYFGTEEERTATIVVTAPDGVTTQTYEILFNVTGYHETYGFPNTGGNLAAPGWEADGTYVSSSQSNGIYAGDNALRFTTLSSTLFTNKYNGVDTISFYTMVEMNDASEIQAGEKLTVSTKSQDEIFWTDVATLVTGTDITGDWQEKRYTIDNESDSVQIRFVIESTNESTRIYLDDIAISGHPTFLDPNNYVDVTEIQKASLKVFPNPASERFFIQLPQERNSGELVISNLIGQKVKRMMLRENTNVVSVSDLPMGIYILSVNFDDDNQISQKIMIK